MRATAAIVDVEADIDRLVKEAREAYQASRVADDEARRRRLDLGMLLANARKRWPRSGPKAVGWSDFLARVGISVDAARDAMEYAGYVEERFPGDLPETLPSRREAGLDSSRADDREPPPPSDADVPREVADEVGGGDDDDIDRDTWCTPSWITEALGSFDLDPCSNERSTVQATYAYRLDRGEDGLKLATKKWIDPTSTRVFVNPPYSDVAPWIEVYGATRFCFLLKLDTSTKWFVRLFELAETIYIPRRRRVGFVPPEGVPADRAKAQQFPHALFYARDEDATDAIRALCFPPWRTK